MMRHVSPPPTSPKGYRESVRWTAGASRGWVPAMVILLLATAAAWAAPRERGEGRDRFKELVFAPELVMAHQGDIGFTAEQKRVFVEQLQSAQSDLVPIQLEMAEAAAALNQLLGAPHVDEKAAVAAAARVMELEARVKGRHMRLLIRIKNLLTAEQQAALLEIRAARNSP